MKTSELKSKLDFYVDALYQKGYELGYECALEELDVISNQLWNDGLEVQANGLRDALEAIREGSNE
jgi:hypothetical protein